MPNARAILCAAAAAGGVGLFAAALCAVLVPGDGHGVFGLRERLALCGAVATWGLAFLLAPGRVRRRMAAGTGGLVVALLAVEVVLRLFFGLHHASVLALDEECLYRLRPESRRYFERTPENGGERITVTVGSDGFRGAEPARPEGGRRIAVFGDSFIEAEFSELEDTFVQQLAARLSKDLALPVEAVNGGVVGYGPDQVNLRLQRDLPRLEPDLLIVAICAENDYGDLVRNKLYLPSDDGGLTPNRFVIGDSLRAEFARSHWPLLPRILFQRLQRLAEAVRYGPPAPFDQRRRWALELCVEEVREFALERDDVVRNLFWDHPDEDVRLRPSSESARYKVRFMDAMLALIRSTADAADVPLLLVIIPAAADVGEAFDGHTVDREEFPAYEPTNLTAPLVAICKQRGLEYVNLFPAFRAGEADELHFHGADVHWNDAGQALAARLVAEHVLAAELLP